METRFLWGRDWIFKYYLDQRWPTSVLSMVKTESFQISSSAHKLCPLNLGEPYIYLVISKHFLLDNRIVLHMY
jgi:hypothetical protein